MNKRATNIIKAANLGQIMASTGDVSINNQHKHAEETPGKQPVINLHRGDDDSIEAIEVTCGCGQTLIIECVYDD